MKKVFMTIASIALMVSMVGFVSCKKNNDDKKPTPTTNSDDPKTPSEDPSAEPEAIIVIDGKFDDWAKAEGVVSVSMNDANKGIVIDGNNQRIDGLKTAKVVADADFLYIYLEADMTVKYGGGTSWDGSPLGEAFAGPIDIYINADNNSETGGIYWTFSPAGWEYLYESGSFFSQEPGEVAEHSFDQFTGEDGTDIWAVDPPAKESVLKDGMVSAFTAKEGDIIKAEMSIIRAFMPKITGNKIAIGFVQQSSNWTLHGVLPQVACEAGAFTAGTMLEVTLP